jgi:hypothetical protein
VLIYIRPHGGAPGTPRQIASARQPEIERPGATVAPAATSEGNAQSERPKNSFAPKAAASNLSGQKKHAAGGLNLPETKSHQMAAKISSPPIAGVNPSISLPVVDQAVAPQTISPRIQSELPLNGRNVTNLQQLSTAPPAQAAAAQNSLAEKKDLPALGVERASEQDATLAGLSGRITDRSGALVAGATVTLRDASGNTRRTTTGTDGSFHLTELAPGHYELTAAATGFETKKQPIELKPSELAMLQPVLDVGTVSEAVTVEAQSAAVTVQTESANVSGQVIAEISSAGRVSAVPSGLAVAATVSHGKRFLSLDSAGNLFLSHNGGKKWKKIKPQWTGKVVGIELTPAYMSEVAPKHKNETSGPASAVAVFQLTTDADAVWTSKDGAHWRQQ